MKKILTIELLISDFFIIANGIRYVGANHESDYTGLDPWIKRIVKWKKEGLKELNFFKKSTPSSLAIFLKAA